MSLRTFVSERSAKNAVTQEPWRTSQAPFCPRVVRLETRLAPAVSMLNHVDSIWSGAAPPDTTGAAGPYSYIESGNAYVTIYNKSTNGVIAYDNLSHFLGTIGGVPGSLSDATMVYDEPIGRFIVSDMNIGGDGNSGSGHRRVQVIQPDRPRHQ